MEALLDHLELHFSNPWVPALVKASFILLIFALLLVVSGRFFRPGISRLILFFGGEPDDNVITAFLRLFRRILVLIGAGFVISSLPLPTDIEIFIHNGIFVVIAFFILLGLFDLSNIIGLIVRQKAMEFEILVNRVLKIIFACIVLMVTMRHFDYDIWHIMTALGVGTLAVGLAAQPTLTNMIAGFTILLDRPFRRGDRISLSGGETGDVVNIGMRSTHILTPDGNMLVVSNAELVSSRLINYSFPNNKMAFSVKFYVDLQSDLAKVKTLLKSLASAAPGLVKDSLSVLSSGVNGWGIEITISFKVEYFGDSGKVIDHIIDSAMVEFQKQAIRLATSPLPPPLKF